MPFGNPSIEPEIRMPGAFPTSSRRSGIPPNHDRVGENPGQSSGAQTENNINGPKIGKNDIVIALMGVTGSGKSTFISHCTSEYVEIGHGMESCTQQVKIYPCQYTPSRKIWLVDNPGFDDSNRTDTDVLKELATWLKETYENKIKLAGIIYLHCITDDRMRGSAQRNLSIFRSLCGNDALRRVLLATTKWEEVSEETGIKREKQLSETEQFWGAMIRLGSQIKRHFNTRKSALDLLSSFFTRGTGTSGIVLDIQAQMVDQGKTLLQTAAGMEIEAELIRERKKNAEAMEAQQIEFEKAIKENNREMVNVIEAEKREMAKLQEKLDRDNANLRAGLSQITKDNNSLRADNNNLQAFLVQFKQHQDAADANTQFQFRQAVDAYARLDADRRSDVERHRAEMGQYQAQSQAQMQEMSRLYQAQLRHNNMGGERASYLGTGVNGVQLGAQSSQQLENPALPEPVSQQYVYEFKPEVPHKTCYHCLDDVPHTICEYDADRALHIP